MDPYNDALANKYNYLKVKNIETILYMFKNIPEQVKRVSSKMEDILIIIYIDFNNAIDNANLNKQEEKILDLYYFQDLSLELSALKTNIAIGTASKVKKSLLNKIYKSLNGEALCNT